MGSCRIYVTSCRGDGHVIVYMEFGAACTGCSESLGGRSQDFGHV